MYRCDFAQLSPFPRHLEQCPLSRVVHGPKLITFSVQCSLKATHVRIRHHNKCCPISPWFSSNGSVVTVMGTTESCLATPREDHLSRQSPAVLVSRTPTSFVNHAVGIYLNDARPYVGLRYDFATSDHDKAMLTWHRSGGYV